MVVGLRVIDETEQIEICLNFALLLMIRTLGVPVVQSSLGQRSKESMPDSLTGDRFVENVLMGHLIRMLQM
jgi:hypothetical protein